jgi:hypothetical protein
MQGTGGFAMSTAAGLVIEAGQPDAWQVELR